jgi:hypothetical protein
VGLEVVRGLVQFEQVGDAVEVDAGGAALGVG